MRDKPDEARRLSQLYAQIGSLAPRLEGVHRRLCPVAAAGRAEGAVPGPNGSRWRSRGDFIVVRAHASRCCPATLLKNHLWSAVRGAVLTRPR